MSTPTLPVAVVSLGSAAVGLAMFSALLESPVVFRWAASDVIARWVRKSRRRGDRTVRRAIGIAVLLLRVVFVAPSSTFMFRTVADAAAVRFVAVTAVLPALAVAVCRRWVWPRVKPMLTNRSDTMAAAWSAALAMGSVILVLPAWAHWLQPCGDRWMSAGALALCAGLGLAAAFAFSAEGVEARRDPDSGELSGGERVSETEHVLNTLACCVAVAAAVLIVRDVRP